VGAALAHQFRLVVAAEFLTELERTTREGALDPILALAKKLPRLPSVDSVERNRLAELIHQIVFLAPGHAEAKSVQALSDCQHLAHAALARAAGYVTSDGKVLAARVELRHKLGIDVTSLEEFVEILMEEQSIPDQLRLEGTDCTFSATPLIRIHAFLKSCGVPVKIIDEFPPEPANATLSQGVSISEGDDVVAIGVLKNPPTVDAPARALVHIRPDHVACDIFADKIIDSICREASRTTPVAIEMTCSPGQAVVRQAAILRGFLPTTDPTVFVKVAIGRPITMSNWDAVVQQTRRKTGLIIPDRDVGLNNVKEGVSIKRSDGTRAIVPLPILEEALAPTIISWPGRNGVIVPIARSYAADLLGTDSQFKLFGNPEASFATRRTYFCSPRVAGLLRPSTPILFYESVRSGGRGAIIAAARVVDASIERKEHVPAELLRRAVVDDPEQFSTSADVLAVVFDTVLCLPRPVPLAELRRLNAVGSANFQTSTVVDSAKLGAILDFGWSRA
jgi:hypothetical protein